MSRLLMGLLASVLAVPALAVSPFVVRDIRIEGVARTEPGTVFSYLPIRVGDTFDDDKGSELIRALYGTGFFKDVRVEAQGDVVVVIVEERPAIAEVNFSGNKEFETDNLRKALRDVGIAEARIYDKALIDRAEQELKQQYLSRGKYGLKVTTTVTPIERNRVNVTFAVDEGEVARIKEIRIIGNKAFSEKELLEQFTLRTPGWFTWFSKNDQYSKQKLGGDLESLRSFYLNRGYLEFNVESTQVSISPDRDDIFVTIAVSEGEKYTVSDVKFSGELLGQESELRKLLRLKPGDSFSGERMTESVKAMTERFGALGFAFASVNPVAAIDRDKQQVAFNVTVDAGKRAYVRRINVVGNTRTRDEVVRREARQFESAWYDAERIRISRDRIDRLGYFQEVNVDTAPVPGTTDQVDVTYTVKEKATGQFTIGAGYNSTEKLVISGSISQANVFGSGKTLGIEVNTSKSNRTLSLTTVDPYYTVDGVSRSIEAYLKTVKQSGRQQGAVDIDTRGASIRFGIPFAETDTVFFGFGAERTGLKLFGDSPTRYVQYVADFGDKSTSIFGTVGWGKDSRDNALAPTRGRFQTLNATVSPAGDLRYYRADYTHQYFWPASNDLTLAFNGQATYGSAFGSRPYPFFKNVYAGGIGSVRSFDSSSLGPREVSANGVVGNAIGGTKRLIGNFELQLPLPGQGKDRTARMFAFVDGGYVWGDDQKIRLGDMRYSAGIGLAWLSPVGPLKLSYGKPIKRQPEDRVERFQFQIGTGF